MKSKLPEPWTRRHDGWIGAERDYVRVVDDQYEFIINEFTPKEVTFSIPVAVIDAARTHGPTHGLRDALSSALDVVNKSVAMLDELRDEVREWSRATKKMQQERDKFRQALSDILESPQNTNTYWAARRLLDPNSGEAGD